MSASAPLPVSVNSLTVPTMPASKSRISLGKTLSTIPGVPVRVTNGNAGDHSEIQHLLSAVFQAPSRDSFLASLEEPLYEPTDRLLVERAGKIVSHVHLLKREMHFESERFPASVVSWLGTLPEFRSQGYAGALMDEAERQMLAEGAQLGFLSTKIPHFFRPGGWAVCGRHSHSTAGTRDVLAELSRQSERLKQRPLTIRPWRQVELPTLMRIYHENTARGTGPWCRNESYWRWLITRNTTDQFWVAIEGPDKMELDQTNSPIVGYAISRDDQVLEAMAFPDHPTAELLLLGRACSEAIERDSHSITVHARPGSELHEICRLAGGTNHCHEVEQGQVFMAKLLAPLRFLKGLRPLIRERAIRAGIPLPSELGLLVEGEKYHIKVTRRGAVVSRDKTGRSYLNMNIAEFTRLLLGHLDLDPAIAQGRIEASTRVAVETAAALFPRLPLWRSPLEDGMG